jgi:hypothetical protein
MLVVPSSWLQGRSKEIRAVGRLPSVGDRIGVGVVGGWGLA